MQFPPVKNAIFSRIFVAIVLVSFAAQFAVLIRFSQAPDFIPQGDDMKFYSDWGLRIAHGQLTDGRAFYGLPGYAFILGGFYKVLGFDPFAVGVVQAALFAAVAGVIYLLASRAFSSGESDRRASVVGILAALGWTCFLPAQTFSAILMPTIWLVLAYWTCVTWLATVERPSLKAWLFLGIIVGGFSMIVATILFVTPLVLAAVWMKVAPGEKWQQRLKLGAVAAALYVGGLFAGSAPASLHNHLVAHEPVMLSAHSGINFWIGNNPTATGYPKMPPGIRASQDGLLKDSITLAETARGRQLTRAEVSAFWTQQAHDWIGTHPREWLRLMGTKFVNFWNAYQYDDISSIKLLRDMGVTWPGLGFGVVAAFGLAGMSGIFAHPRSRWIAAAVVLHMAALMPVFVTERYRLAAVPGLLIFGAWWLVAVARRIEQREWRGVFPLVALAFGAAWFVSIPRADATLWSLDHYKAGIRATQSAQQPGVDPAARAADLDRAERNLLAAVSYSPRSPDVHFALGNLWLERGDRTRAKGSFRRALELNPKHEGVLNNLGVLAMEEQRWELAEKFFAASIAADPQDAKRHYLLARARYERGDKAGAKDALSRALSLRPAQREFLELQQKLNEEKLQAPN